MEQKKFITKCVGDIACSDLDGLSFEKVVELFSQVMVEGSTLDYNYDGQFDVLAKRDETDEEFNRRIDSSKQLARLEEKVERETLKRLKEKYE